MAKEQKFELLEYQPTQPNISLLDRTSKIVILRNPDQITGMATPARVEGRKIIGWSSHCGTYGQGGPGFFGLRLEAKDQLPEEWLILTLWNADNWLEFNGRWVGAHPDQYQIQKPLYSNFSGLKKDEVTPLLNGKTLESFDVNEKSAVLKIGDSLLKINEDPITRPVKLGSGKPRSLDSNDDLRNAWIISPVPNVVI